MQWLNIQAVISNSLDEDQESFEIDKLRTQQILINLIQNAINFSNLNDTLRIHIDCVQEEEQVYVVVKVTD